LSGESRTFTYQARLELDAHGERALNAYAQVYGRAERKLFAAVAAGASIDKLKSAFITEFGLTARQFNAISAGLKGKIASIKERRVGLLAEAKLRRKKAADVVKKLSIVPKNESSEDKAGRLFALHQKKRRLQMIDARLLALQGDHDAGKVRVAFGSKKLFRSQFDLGANGYDSHGAWRKDWQTARSSQFMVLGSKDETAGCQGCVATLADDGSLTLRLRLRLPDALAEGDADLGRYATLSGVRFAYGMADVLAALSSSRRVEKTSASGKTSQSRDGTAMTYRFTRDDRGWRVMVSVAVKPKASRSKAGLGAIGLDFNADHLALAEVDRFGNLVDHQRIDTFLAHRDSEQRRAIMGDAVKLVVAHAVKQSKPIVIERLDFSDKKAQLETVDPVRARSLSALAYSQFEAMLRSAAFRAGVDVLDVNPAYTSVIGAVNTAQRRGISVHLGAAHAIARRGLGLGERPIARQGQVTVSARHGGHVTFALPERNRAKHVWSQWSGVRRRLSAALREHYRCGAAKAAAPPLSQALRQARTVCATGGSMAGFHHASRQQHCSADATLTDVPF